MSRLLRRIKRAPRTSADDSDPQSSQPTASVAAAHEASAESGSESPLPAGQDPADARPTALRRGRLRKRLRFLERQRELLLRDLGGLVYEIHRTGAPADREHHRELVSSKVQRLASLDAEHGAGLASLRVTRSDTVLREPGVGGSCPNCGEILGSDARFCSACGTQVGTAPAVEQPAAGVVAPATADPALPGPGPGRPQPAPASTQADTGSRALPPRGEDPATGLHRPPPGEDPVTEFRPPETGADETRAELRRSPSARGSEPVTERGVTAPSSRLDPVPEPDRPAPASSLEPVSERDRREPPRSSGPVTEIEAGPVRSPDRQRP